MRRALLLLAAWVVLTGSPVAAQNWYESILPERSHDFGTVARGSRVHHAFRIVNTTSYDVHIAGIRKKCGCTDAVIGANDIPPGTQTTVDLTLDTSRFEGYKPSGVTLIFDRPQYVEVDLNLSSFIRSDVMLSPGSADFGIVSRGTSRNVVLNLSYYGGRPDWRIARLNTISDHITAELRDLGRTAGGPAQYQLTVTLKPTTPVGFFKDEITLATNDAEVPTIPVSVSAELQAAVTISPSSILNFGRLRPGEEVKRTVLVKSSQPFKITGTNSAKPELTATGQLSDAKPFHAVTVTFKAPTQPGPYNAALEFATDLKDEPPTKLTAFATIVP